MRDITATFMLSDEDEKRLQKITELYRQHGLDLSEDKMFKLIMFTGSEYDIDKKFRFHECKLGLRENYMEG